MDHPEAELIGLQEASELLEEPVEQVRALVEQGLLTPVGPEGEDPRFQRAEVMAARHLGG